VFEVISVVISTRVSVQYEIKMDTNKHRMSTLFTIQHYSRSKDTTQIDRQNHKMQVVKQCTFLIKQLPSILLN